MSETTTESGAAPVSRAEPERRRALRYAVLSLMMVAVLFCGIVAGVLLATRGAEAAAPPDQTALDARRRELNADPSNARLREELRAEDARIRTVFVANRRRLAGGAVLLLVGAAVLVLCSWWYVALDPRRPMPGDPETRSNPDGWFARRRLRVAASAGVLAVLAVAVVVMAVAGGGDFPRGRAPANSTGEGGPDNGGAENGSGDVGPRPTDVEDVAYKDNWPHFRGPTAMGVVPAGDWPLRWDVTTGANIVWKTPVPGPGMSSPVMWGNRIFLTGADAERQEVYCFERSSGRLVWTATVPRRKPPPGPDDDPETTEETGHAAPTPATDGERVYAFFASGDLAAVDYDAGIVWAKNMGAPESFYGIATSPLVHDGRVILQYDRGDDAEADKSALLALDPRTGDVLWRTPRPVVNSWSSPVVARTGGGERIIAVADPFLIAYDAATGAEKWRARTVTGDVAPCPVVAGGRVYVTNEYSDAMAVRLGGEGDVTESHVAWRNMDSQQSDAASPVCDGRFFFQVHSSGTATCHDAADGRVLWEREFTREDDEGEDVPEVFWASPTLVGDLVYLPAKKGRTYVFRLGAQYEEVGFGALDEETYATPAFGDGRIYVRTVDHLFCIGKPDEKPEEATAD